jgi:phenylacetic acid degradation operon negative regulatory protein
MSAAASDSSEADLPRAQAGNNPQRVILTLFGDYWFHHREDLPSAALVALTADFGISAPSARVALGRLTHRELLRSSKRGRNTYYGITPKAQRLLEDTLERVLAFGLTDAPWDHTWTVVTFSIPEHQRDLRHALRSRLRSLGFAPLYDGAWVSPRRQPTDAATVLDDLGIRTATIFRGQVAPTPHGREPSSAWDLDDLRARYDAFITEANSLLERARARRLDPAAALVARAQTIGAWGQFTNLDPELPTDLLPSPWPRRHARQLFADAYDALGSLGEEHFRAVLSVHAPELAPLARHFTTTRPVNSSNLVLSPELRITTKAGLPPA